MMNREVLVFVLRPPREIGNLIDDLIGGLELIDTLDKLVLCHRVDVYKEVILAAHYQVHRVPPEILEDQVLADSLLRHHCGQVNEPVLNGGLELLQLALLFLGFLPSLSLLALRNCVALLATFLVICFRSPTLFGVLTLLVAATAPLFRVRAIAYLRCQHVLEVFVLLHFCKLLLLVSILLSCSLGSSSLCNSNFAGISTVSARPELPSIGEDAAKLVATEDFFDQNTTCCVHDRVEIFLGFVHRNVVRQVDLARR